MLANFEKQNYIDPDQNPSGGYVKGVGLDIQWQNGPLGRGADRKEPNGAFVETVIATALQRIQFYQDGLDGKPNTGKFSCRENAIAITKLEEALMWLNKRTKRREVEQTEGTHAGK